MIHQSVLLKESIEGLNIKEGDIFVDGTLGGGGHIEEVIKKYNKGVKIYAFDADSDAIVRAKKRLEPLKGDITYIHGNFRKMEEILTRFYVKEVNAILLDIGFSSNQLEESSRGFSFRNEEKLDMRMDVSQELTAEIILNEWEEDSLRSIIKGYGEEKWAGRIARRIVDIRKLVPIKTTTDLLNIILSATPKSYHRQRLHPATRTFQALRITVNDELGSLSEGIEQGFRILAKEGRMAVISFHSLEDRIVKDYFKILDQTGIAKKVNKKPTIATNEEVIKNQRARSAKLRILEKKVERSST